MPLLNPANEDTPRHQVHVAVLDTDVPCPAVYAKRGLHSSQFRVLLQAAAERLNQHPQSLRHGRIQVHVTAYDIVGGSYPPPEFLRAGPQSPTDSTAKSGPTPIDAILVTGAAAAAYDNLPWIPGLQAFIQTVHAKYPFVRIYGSCFGHQLIAQALLAGQQCSIGDFPSKISVEPSVLGHEIGVHPIILDPEFSSRFSSLAQFSQERPLQLQLIHGDIVTPSQDIPPSPERLNLPDPWINVGSSEKCLIQGLYYPGRVLTLQGHFEFDAFASGELCRQFSRMYDWPAPKLKFHLESIWSSPQAIDGPAGPYDDSKAVAEMALLFFADEDRPTEE